MENKKEMRGAGEAGPRELRRPMCVVSSETSGVDSEPNGHV
jgi:hypothetical protein